MVKLYSATTSGTIILNRDTLVYNKHNQIICHQIDNNSMLCEVKPFVQNEYGKQYLIKGVSLKLIENKDTIYIYFKGVYYGSIKQNCYDIKFDKLEKNNQEYGAVYLLGNTKYIILFDNNEVIFCGQYVDIEVLKDCIQIYAHIPNIFNTGELIKYNFMSKELQYKCINDRGEEHKQINTQFNIIYFLESIKCGRYKYAYNKLSYELKSEIDINVLSKYFTPFDEYSYLYEQDAYITMKNNKIVGIYHFSTTNNLINNIY